jgi:catechol 2,3-dioxygenase-like lactoylglutathione lyase family enzyme
MDARLSLVTLGVGDFARSQRFYEALGWRLGGPSNEHVAFFQCGGMVLSLYGRAALAEDAGVGNDAGGFDGVALGQNVRERADVDRILEEARVAGGAVPQPAREVFWGGYSGYFADPDGHLWEIAWNPHFPLSEDGTIRLPE